MSDAPNVAAEAPAATPSMPTDAVTEAPAPEPGSDEDWSAIYDEITKGGEVEAAEEVVEAEPEAEAAPQEAAEATPEAEEAEPAADDAEPVEKAPEPAPEAPSFLPKEVKDQWGTFSEAQREAVETSHRILSDRLGEKTRTLQAMEPTMRAIKDVQDSHPDFASMSPQDSASTVKNLLSIAAQIKANPTQAVAGLARQHGINIQDLASAMGLTQRQPGQPAPRPVQPQQPSFSQTDVERIAREQAQAALDKQNFTTQVNAYIQEQGEWETARDDIVSVLPMAEARLGEGADNFAVLKEAYRTAKVLYGPKDQPKPEPSEPKAQVDAAVEKPAAKPDPERAKAAKVAKKTNVTSSQTGKGRQLTEDQLMSQIWDTAHAS